MSLIVLMSTYNGEKYLKEQLNSIVSQELKPDKLLIRDDGSKDSTLDILKYYSDNYDFIEYYQGENLKPAKSFFELINKAEGYDYYSLADQDDVWFKDKLKVAIETLIKEDNDKPLLYLSRYTMTDENLNDLNAEISSLYNFTDFAHSLLYTTAPGCTFVFNETARKQIIKYDLDKEYNIIHDSIIHKVIACFGKVILDKDSHIFYRQHGNNEIGLPKTKLQNTLERIKHFTSNKSKGTRSALAKSLLNIYGEECSLENKELINIVANYQNNRVLKKKLMNMDCFKSHTINDFFFKLLVMANYI